jgi:K+-transporting ATPase A subunit
MQLIFAAGQLCCMPSRLLGEQILGIFSGLVLFSVCILTAFVCGLVVFRDVDELKKKITGEL